MKPAFIALAGWLLTLSFAAQSQECQPTMLHDDFDSLQLSFTTSRPAEGKVSLDGTQFATLSLEGCVNTTTVGLPELPVFARLIEVPLCEGFEVRVTGEVWDTVDAPGQTIAPVQTPRAKSDTRRYPLDIDRKVYSTDAFYAEALAGVEPVGIARDRSLARLVFSPVRYNPVSRKLAICRQATLTVVYRKPDNEGTKALFSRHYSPTFNAHTNALNSLYAKDLICNTPVRYLIVSHSMFRGYLDNFVQWKRRKGFKVDVVYTDDASVGNTTASISAYIAGQYTNATATNPAPTFLLLIGDVQQIPAFRGVNDTNHYTDLYYATWTSGDHVPDCHYGRFSAQNVSQLISQIDKTLMYEQYSFPDPTFLGRAVMVAGVDEGNPGDNAYQYGDPSMDYVVTQYVNGTNGYQQVRYFKNNTSVVPNASNVIMGASGEQSASLVRQCYDEGAGIINYTAHGSPTCWGTPYFGTDNVPSMSNHGKFGLMIGNCCQSNTFVENTCLGEALLRRGDYAGAVGYIGASNSTYWTWDFYWTVGYRNSVSSTSTPNYSSYCLGAFDRLCHTHGEIFSNWATTQGSIIMAGNMAVTRAAGSGALYYWEIYHLMGDPSVMPYLGQAKDATLTVQPVITTGTVSLPVTAAPYSYVAITDSATHSLFAATYANNNGEATLRLPTQMGAGAYEVVATAQNRRPLFRKVRVVGMQSEAPYAFATSLDAVTPIQAGEVNQLTLGVRNVGTLTASNVVVHLSCNTPGISFECDSVVLSSVEAGEMVEIPAPMRVTVSPHMADGTLITITADATSGTNGRTTSVDFPFYVNAPVLGSRYSDQRVYLLPGDSVVMDARFTNMGHADVTATRLDMRAATHLLSVRDLDTTAFNIPAGQAVTRRVMIKANSLLPQGIVVPMHTQITGTFSFMLSDSLHIVSAMLASETFEGASFHLLGWHQDHRPWIFVNNEADASLWSIRSALNVNDNDSSSISLSYTCSQYDTLRFRYKIISERNYDKFFFYLDNVKKLEVSGVIDWSDFAMPIAPGVHTLRFCYRKDFSQSDSSDCVWIDNLTLPAVTRPVTFRDDSVCMGSLYVLGGDTIATDSAISGSHVVETPAAVSMVNYTIIPSSHYQIVESACDSISYSGRLFTTTSQLDFNYVNHLGCDSIVTVNLIVHHSVTDTFRVFCPNSSYRWEDSVYTASGAYQHSYQTVEGCDSVVTMILNLVNGGEGIAGIDGDTLRAYPSPTAGMVYLSADAVEVTIYDINGRKVSTYSQTHNLNLSALPSGVYTLRLVLPSGTATRRIVKQ